MMDVDTTNFWIIGSVIDPYFVLCDIYLYLALNLTEKIHDMFVDDIAHCYEAIPLEGSDHLMDAISKLISYAYY